MSKSVPTATQPSAFAVELKNVSKTFQQTQRANAGQGLLRGLLRPQRKTITALDNVSFGVKPGEFVAYAGPNGAGKSTTMKLLAGMLIPGSGDIRVLGYHPGKQRIPLMQKLGVLFGNRTEMWWDHPVSQSFEWKRVVWDIPEPQYKQKLGQLVDMLEIGDLLQTFARELSLGQRMRCDLALMLLHSPQLILLDEPTLGLDVVAKRQMIRFLKELNREDKVTVVMTSHDMDDLEEMAQRVLMLANGKLVYDGAFDGLRELTGNRSTVKITTAGGTREWDVNLHETPVARLLHEIADMGEVWDIEIGKAPIEEVVATLYGDWKDNAGTP